MAEGRRLLDEAEKSVLRERCATLGTLRFEEPDTVVSGDGGEGWALGFFVSTHAPAVVDAVNALPLALDALDEGERERETLLARARAEAREAALRECLEIAMVEGFTSTIVMRIQDLLEGE